MLQNIYIVCLTVGALYTLLSLIFGQLLDFDFDFDFDLGALMLPIKPFTIMTFLAVFGGMGLIMQNYLPAAFSLLPAIPTGLGVSWLLHHFVYAKLKKYESRAPKEEDSIMQRAEVVERIAPGGYGKISFVVNGNTLSGAAREKHPANGIGKGKKVYIVDYADNTYFVCEDLEFYVDTLLQHTRNGGHNA